MPNDAPDWTSFVTAQTLLINGATVAQDGAVHDLGSVTLPGNTHSVEAVWKSTTAILGFNVIGSVTGIDWTNIGLVHVQVPAAKRFALPVRQAIDPAVDIKFQFTAGGGNAQVWLIALTDTSFETLDASQPGTVLIGGIGGQVVTTLAARAGLGGENLLAVSQEDSNPPAWLRANQPQVQLSAQLGAGTNAQLIAAPGAGLRLYLHSIPYFFTATSNSFGAFRRASGSGTPIHAWNSNSAQVFDAADSGVPMGINEALFVSNDSAVAMAGFFNGHIAYSIGT